MLKSTTGMSAMYVMFAADLVLEFILCTSGHDRRDALLKQGESLSLDPRFMCSSDSCWIDESRFSVGIFPCNWWFLFYQESL